MSFVGQTMTLLRDVRHLGVPILRRFVSRRDADGRQRIHTRHGLFWIRPTETDLDVVRQVHFVNSYDLSKYPQSAQIDQRYASIVRRGKCPVIIDAGANIGVAARWFANRYSMSQVVAVEPDPETIKLCRLNTASEQRIEVREAAIGAKPGAVDVERYRGHAWGTRTRRSAAGLPVVTVPELVHQVPEGELFIVKIDIEGFESDLFASDTGWIDEAFVVIVELHDWLFPDRGTSRSAQRAMMSRDRDLIVSGENLVWIG